VSVHHIPGSLFWGYDAGRNGTVWMASPEKALFDFCYLGPARSRLFVALPELALPSRFSKKRMQAMIAKIPDRKRQVYVQGRIDDLLTVCRAPS
jgi:hypothetical protein